MARDRDSRDAWENEFEEEQPLSTSSGGMLDKFTGAPWVQDHPNLLKGIAVGASLILMALLLAWQMNWLQGTPEATPADANRPPQAAEQKQPPAGAQPAPPAAKTPPATKAPEVPKTADKQNVKPEGPRPLPDDVSQWKKEDYFRARVENNPKLVEAVARLGEKTRGSIPAAQGLIALLMPLPPMPPPGAGPPAAAPGTAAAGSPRPAPQRAHRQARRRRGLVCSRAQVRRRRGHAIPPTCRNWSRRSSAH